MTIRDFITIILIFTPLLIGFLWYYKAFDRYRNLYQERLLPNFPFSRKAIREAINKNPLSFFISAPIAPFYWWKTIFQHIKDAELKIVQRKIRIFLLFFIIYIIGIMLIFSII